MPSAGEKWWVIQLEGQDYKLNLDSGLAEVGFLTTRAAIAESEEDAIRQAIESVSLELAEMTVDDPFLSPRIGVARTASVTAKQAKRIPATGFTFFVTDTDAD